MSFAVADNPEVSRYEIRDGDDLVGIAAYDYRAGDMIVFTHTEVSDDYEGQGVGSQLARESLDDARRRGLRVVVRCPFITAWIKRHPDYADLVA
jgi:uncharacterized protein